MMSSDGASVSGRGEPSTILRPDEARRLGLLAIVAILGAAFWATALVAMHFLGPQTNDTSTISEYAVGPYGGLYMAADVALGIGFVALAFGVRGATTASRTSRIGSLLVGLNGLGWIVGGLFVVDPECGRAVAASLPCSEGGEPVTAHGAIHGLSGAISILSLIVGMLLLSRAFKRDDRWRTFRPVSLALGLGTLAQLVVGLFVLWGEGKPLDAASFRIFMATLVLWLVLAAIRLRSITRGASIRQPARVR
jgi:NADH:ubiquinone oxidoreductase subunit 6 (subunit J)